MTTQSDTPRTDWIDALPDARAAIEKDGQLPQYAHDYRQLARALEDENARLTKEAESLWAALYKRREEVKSLRAALYDLAAQLDQRATLNR